MSSSDSSCPSEGEISIDSARMSSSGSSSSGSSSVSFSTIEFHEHAMVLGDNPSTSIGPSIEIDWTEQSYAVVPIEEYESMRYPRRTKEELIMPRAMRTTLLLDNGYTMREIRDSASSRRPLNMHGSSGSFITKKFSKLLPSRFRHSSA
eukprot:scaffold11248_cov60-Cylindrotheca_fusiformis.AAC.5